jgi:hypothetical protein
MPRRGPALPDAAWAAIVAAAAPHEPGSGARPALNDIVHDYLARRPDLRSDKRLRTALAAALKKLSETQKALHRIRQRMPRPEDDGAADPWLRRLQTVIEIKRQVEDEHAALAAKIGAHQGRQNPERARFYDQLLLLWVQHFDGILSFSMLHGEPPYGPVISFIVAVFKHALDERAPSPHTIADNIKERR